MRQIFVLFVLLCNVIACAHQPMAVHEAVSAPLPEGQGFVLADIGSQRQCIPYLFSLIPLTRAATGQELVAGAQLQADRLARVTVDYRAFWWFFGHSFCTTVSGQRMYFDEEVRDDVRVVPLRVEESTVVDTVVPDEEEVLTRSPDTVDGAFGLTWQSSPDKAVLSFDRQGTYRWYAPKAEARGFDTFLGQPVSAVRLGFIQEGTRFVLRVVEFSGSEHGLSALLLDTFGSPTTPNPTAVIWKGKSVKITLTGNTVQLKHS